MIRGSALQVATAPQLAQRIKRILKKNLPAWTYIRKSDFIVGEIMNELKKEAKTI